MKRIELQKVSIILHSMCKKLLHGFIDHLSSANSWPAFLLARLSQPSNTHNGGLMGKHQRTPEIL